MSETHPRNFPGILVSSSLVLALIAFGFVNFASGQSATAPNQAAAASGTQSQAPLPRGKKLFLKDGTFQLVSSYQIDGDRIRYYSLTQHDWEEMPSALVDWDATKKEEAKQAEQDAKLLSTAGEQEHARGAEMTLDVDASLEILPKVFLPPGEGVFVLDGKSIYPLKQAETDEKLNKKHTVEQVLVPIPIIPSRKDITLDGARSRFRIDTSQPEFYLRTTEPGQPDLSLLRLRVRKDARLVENVDTTFFEQKQVRNALPMQLWEIATGVYRFTLNQTLEPGEYALAQAIQENDYGTNKPQMELLVWDFGVDAPNSDASSQK